MSLRTRKDLNSGIGSSDQGEKIRLLLSRVQTRLVIQRGRLDRAYATEQNYQHIHWKHQEMEGTGVDVPSEAPNKCHELVQIPSPIMALTVPMSTTQKLKTFFR
jgi:hypothetical protein